MASSPEDNLRHRLDADAGEEEEEEEMDRLRSIHRHILSSEKDSPSESASAASTTWLPLESNPDIFNLYARQSAHLQEWEFVDVLGFEEELLSSELVPRPVVGVILLFPCTDKIYDYRGQQKTRLVQTMQQEANDDGQSSDVSTRDKLFHIEQVKGFGNACGTIAATHALLNTGLATPEIPDPFAAGKGGKPMNKDSPLHAYKSRANSILNLDNRTERGKLLVQTPEVHAVSDDTALNIRYCQTQCPATGDTYLGHHYCSFVPVKNDVAEGGNNIHVFEMDGTKVCPVDHGPISGDEKNGDDDFLHKVAKIVRKEWMAIEPTRIDFSMMALVPKKV